MQHLPKINHLHGADRISMFLLCCGVACCSGSLSSDLENQSSLRFSPSIGVTAHQQQQTRSPPYPPKPADDRALTNDQDAKRCAATNGEEESSSRPMKEVRFGRQVDGVETPFQLDDSATQYNNTRISTFEVQQAAAAAVGGDGGGDVGSSNQPPSPQQQQQQQVSRRLTQELLDQAHHQRRQQQQQQRSPFALNGSGGWHARSEIMNQPSLRDSDLDGAWSSDSSTGDARVDHR